MHAPGGARARLHHCATVPFTFTYKNKFCCLKLFNLQSGLIATEKRDQKLHLYLHVQLQLMCSSQGTAQLIAVTLAAHLNFIVLVARC